MPDGAVLLGEEDGTAYWAVRVPDPAEAHANDAGSGFLTAEQWARTGGGPDHENWTDLRTSGADLDARGAGLLTTAVALLNWHDRSRFCCPRRVGDVRDQGGLGAPVHARTSTRSTRAPTRR